MSVHSEENAPPRGVTLLRASCGDGRTFCDGIGSGAEAELKRRGARKEEEDGTDLHLSRLVLVESPL